MLSSNIKGKIMYKNKIYDSIEMGCLCGIIGFIIGIFFYFIADKGVYFDNFWIYSTISSSVCGSIIWYFFVIKKNKYERGVMSGLIISISSQYILWYMKMVERIFCFYFTGNCTNSFGESPPNIFSSLYISAMLLLISLLSFGWVTLPLGGVLGGIMAKRHKERHNPESVRDIDQ